MFDEKPFSKMECLWSDEGSEWVLKDRSGDVYGWYDIVPVKSPNPNIDKTWEYYVSMVENTSKNRMFNMFFLSWLEMMFDLYVLYCADENRMEYLKANPKKGKQSEGVYEKYLKEYRTKYL